MGFLSCFGCGSADDELPEKSAPVRRPAEGASGASGSKGTDAAGASADAGVGEKAASGKPAGGETPRLAQQFVDAPNGLAADNSDFVATGEPPAIGPETQTSDVTSPEEQFGQQHRIDDYKLQQAKKENPFPVQSPIGSDSTSGLGKEEWHETESRLHNDSSRAHTEDLRPV